MDGTKCQVLKLPTHLNYSDFKLNNIAEVISKYQKLIQTIKLKNKKLIRKAFYIYVE